MQSACISLLSVCLSVYNIFICLFISRSVYLSAFISIEKSAVASLDFYVQRYLFSHIALET